MSLSLWKDFDDFFADPWRPHHHVLPYWLRNRPWRDDFALGLYPRDFWEMDRELARNLHNDIDWSPIISRKGFQVSVDVQQFSPSELSITMNENSVTVEGKHEERQDEHGYIARQFSRRYTLPAGFDANTVTSELSSDGILTIKAPALENNERQVSIQRPGPARVTFKDDKKLKL